MFDSQAPSSLRHTTKNIAYDNNNSGERMEFNLDIPRVYSK